MYDDMVAIYIRKYASKCPNPSFPSFSLSGGLCDPTDQIWRKGTPFDAMTGRIDFIDCLLGAVFLSCKVTARGLMHSPWHHLINILIISRQTWHLGQVTIGWEPARDLVAQPYYLKTYLTAAQGSMYNRSSTKLNVGFKNSKKWYTNCINTTINLINK